MARTAGSRNNNRPRRSPTRSPLSDETRRGIAVVVCFAIGVVGALAFAGIAGSAGRAIAAALRALFGIAAFLVPVIAFIVAAQLLQNDESEHTVFTATHGIGFFLLAVALTGLLHLTLGDGAPPTLPAIADGGGYLGLVLAVPMARLFGRLAATIILACCTIIGIFVGFRLSFAHMKRAWRTIAALIRGVRLALLAAKYRRSTEENAADDVRFRERALEDADDTDDAAEASTVMSAPAETSPHAPNDAMVATITRRRKRRARIELPLDLLSNEIGKPTSGDIRIASEVIRKTLAEFGIEVEMGEVSVGPTVTQFTFRPSEGVKLSRITGLQNDLALALAAHPIRIEAPIPGKSLVGVEVPNAKVAVVHLREILEADAFRKRASPLTAALGKDVAGNVWVADIARMPHLLVAGATGSGKSVMLNAIIVSLLYANGPDELRFLLVDPKRVEFPIYNGIPHLLTPVITDVKKTVSALSWALAEMDRRFELLASATKRDLAGYNATRSNPDDRLPYLVIIIDELADLMAVAATEVEAAIIRLAQMARAVGIHLIVATQRPSVDVLTGLIKANITSRIAFAVASSIDSRTILDTAGADRLLGRGDMLFTTAELSKPRRLQGAFVAEKEVARVVEHLKGHSESADFVDGVTDARPIVEFREADGGDDDDLLPDAKEVLLQAGKGSASLLQRRLKIGYARAARILDILERRGFIGPADGAKPREVFGRSTDDGLQTPAAESDPDTEIDGRTEHATVDP